MGAAGSSAAGALAPEKERSAFALVQELVKAIENADLDTYRDLWSNSLWHRERKSEELRQAYDLELVENEAISKIIAFGMRHAHVEWREVALKAAESFLYLKEARKELVKLNLTKHIWGLTMWQEDGHGNEVEAHRHLLAARMLDQMVDHKEFQKQIATTEILNTLCITLNQVHDASEFVTRIFRKLSDISDERRGALMEGNVGDVLEDYLKTVDCKRPGQGFHMDDWKRSVRAMANAACTLATLMKFRFPVQIETRTVIETFNTLIGSKDDADCFGLNAELARLIFWMSITADSLEDRIFDKSMDIEGPDYVLNTICKMWDICVGTYELIRDPPLNRDPSFFTDDLDSTRNIKPDSKEAEAKMAAARKLMCHLNLLLWLCLPIHKCRWKMRSLKVTKIDIAFNMREPELFSVTLSTIRHLLDLPATQCCRDLVSFFGKKLLKLVDNFTDGTLNSATDAQLRLIVDSLSILAFARDMQEILTDEEVFDKIDKLRDVFLRPCDKPWQFYWNDSKGWGRDRWDLSLVRDILHERLFILGEVSSHPVNRLPWIRDPQKFCTPLKANRDQKDSNFIKNLSEYAKGKAKALEVRFRNMPPESEPQALTDESTAETLAAIAQLIISSHSAERSTAKQSLSAQTLEPVVGHLLEYWLEYSTIRYKERKDSAAKGHSGDGKLGRMHKTVKDALTEAIERKKTGKPLTSLETMHYCLPHECVLALSHLSRLALEPALKKQFLKDDAIENLLHCVCTGIWPEAREAAATLANLMWLPDGSEEHLMCWLKFDGPECIAVDAANVLMPLKIGSPKPVDMGRGMYMSNWGIEFVEGSWIELHKDGLRKNNIPTLLTSASPNDTFSRLSRTSYQWMTAPPDPDVFTLTCWFYWTPTHHSIQRKVLVTSGEKKRFKPVATISLEYVEVREARGESGTKGGWWFAFVDDKEMKSRVQMPPELEQGWHHLAIISGKKKGQGQRTETKLYLDGEDLSGTGGSSLSHVNIENDFYIIGNVGEGAVVFNDQKEPVPVGAGSMPFGLIADFRIYASELKREEIERMYKIVKFEDKPVDLHGHRGGERSARPDVIVRRLAHLDAVTILAQRLDVPDCAAECLRALGSLATYGPMRARIYSVCGRQVLRLLNSPFPMVQRQAARLLNNLA